MFGFVSLRTKNARPTAVWKFSSLLKERFFEPKRHLTTAVRSDQTDRMVIDGNIAKRIPLSLFKKKCSIRDKASFTISSDELESIHIATCSKTPVTELAQRSSKMQLDDEEKRAVQQLRNIIVLQCILDRMAGESIEKVIEKDEIFRDSSSQKDDKLTSSEAGGEPEFKILTSSSFNAPNAESDDDVSLIKKLLTLYTSQPVPPMPYWKLYASLVNKTCVIPEVSGDDPKSTEGSQHSSQRTGFSGGTGYIGGVRNPYSVISTGGCSAQKSRFRRRFYNSVILKFLRHHHVVLHSPLRWCNAQTPQKALVRFASRNTKTSDNNISSSETVKNEETKVDQEKEKEKNSSTDTKIEDELCDEQDFEKDFSITKARFSSDPNAHWRVSYAFPRCANIGEVMLRLCFVKKFQKLFGNYKNNFIDVHMRLKKRNSEIADLDVSVCVMHELLERCMSETVLSSMFDYFGFSEILDKEGRDFSRWLDRIEEKVRSTCATTSSGNTEEEKNESVLCAFKAAVSPALNTSSFGPRFATETPLVLSKGRLSCREKSEMLLAVFGECYYFYTRTKATNNCSLTTLGTSSVSSSNANCLFPPSDVLILNVLTCSFLDSIITETALLLILAGGSESALSQYIKSGMVAGCDGKQGFGNASSEGLLLDNLRRFGHPSVTGITESVESQFVVPYANIAGKRNGARRNYRNSIPRKTQKDPSENEVISNLNNSISNLEEAKHAELNGLLCSLPTNISNNTLVNTNNSIKATGGDPGAFNEDGPSVVRRTFTVLSTEISKDTSSVAKPQSGSGWTRFVGSGTNPNSTVSLATETPGIKGQTIITNMLHGRIYTGANYPLTSKHFSLSEKPVSLAAARDAAAAKNLLFIDQNEVQNEVSVASDHEFTLSVNDKKMINDALEIPVSVQRSEFQDLEGLRTRLLSLMQNSFIALNETEEAKGNDTKRGMKHAETQIELLKKQLLEERSQHVQHGDQNAVSENAYACDDSTEELKKRLTKAEKKYSNARRWLSLQEKRIQREKNFICNKYRLSNAVSTLQNDQKTEHERENLTVSCSLKFSSSLMYSPLKLQEPLLHRYPVLYTSLEDISQSSKTDPSSHRSTQSDIYIDYQWIDKNCELDDVQDDSKVQYECLSKEPSTSEKISENKRYKMSLNEWANLADNIAMKRQKQL